MITPDIGPLLSGDRRALSKAISLIESSRKQDRKTGEELLERVLPHSGKSFRIGITGAPGVGKSTLIDALGLHAAQLGKRIAVLAVDPSSPVSGGSILGDKTRMDGLMREPNAFIRPSPSGTVAGGVARRTREAILLCESAGFDLVIVESVGVGQSEVELASMVDMFIVMLLPNSGDGIQGIKRGVLEYADLLVVNKADSGSEAAAASACEQYRAAISLFSRSDQWQPKVLSCSARDGLNIDSIWEVAEEFFRLSKSASDFEKKRDQQNVAWFRKLLERALLERLRNDQLIRDQLKELEREVSAGRLTPGAAVDSIVRHLK